MRNFFRIFILILIIAALGLGAYLIWKNFLRPAPSQVPPGEEKQAGIVVAPSLTLISSQPAFDYWINQTDNAIYYLNAGGEIYKILSDGSEEKVISQTIQNLHQIIPSPNGTSAIVSFGYPLNPTFSIFKTVDASWQPLPEKTTSAAWNPQAATSTLAYLKTESNGLSSLNIVSLADQKPKEIIKISQSDLDLEWVLPDTIYLKQKPSAEIPSSLWAVDLNLGKVDKKTRKPIGPAVRTIAADEPGLMIKWTPTGDTGLKFRGGRDPQTRVLSLINEKNGFLTSFVFTTLPPKCAFQEKNLYCAVPHEVPPGVILPDDYLKRAFYSIDSLYKMNFSNPAITTWTFAEIFDGFQFPLDVSHLEIKNDQLIFINRYDQKLYSLKLQAESPEQTTTTEVTE